ncbi:MAG TPA: hypothetical protein VHH14_03815, partial [Solirubrobacterales bacterium]|nr:hypothetical protein [Solirubrobacterales bacterium]
MLVSTCLEVGSRDPAALRVNFYRARNQGEEIRVEGTSRGFHHAAGQGRRPSKRDGMTAGADLPVMPFASRDAWAAWLEEQHAASDGLWLKFAKKGSGLDTVTYAEAVEVALCYGWIDGQVRKFDEDYYLQRFTPRRARSRWSKINRQKATELIERGEMKPAGLREVERARADGRWDAAYDAPSTATVPEDLRR